MSTPTLPYAPNPTVGCLQATEANGVVTVTASLTRNLLWRLIRVPLFFTVALTLGATWACAVAAPVPWLITWVVVPAGVCVIMGFLFGAILFKRLYIYRHAPSWEASAKGLRVRARTPTQAEDKLFPRKAITLVVADKFTIPGVVYVPMPGVRFFLAGGNSLAVFFGTKPETEFLAGRLAHGMGIEGWTPPPAPRRSPIRVFGVEDGLLILSPQRHCGRWLAMTAVVAFAAGFGGLQLTPFPPEVARGGGILLSLISLTIVASLFSKFARSTRVWLTSNESILTETGLGPSIETRPSQTIDAIMLEKGRLEILFQNQPAHPLFKGLKQSELAWLYVVMNAGLNHARRNLPAAKPEQPRKC